ncbi:MAG: NAD-dependent epimerase [Bacteroidetes bacterium]|nr:MAG: NAD-dependent epimerase [Bacteroidota bacterium]
MAKTNRKGKVLVTGVTGFVGQHCAERLLHHGYEMRGSMRNPSKEALVRNAIDPNGNHQESIEFCHLDLLRDEGWEEAMKGCDYVLHVASPFYINEPKDEQEFIKPAVDGTLRAMRFAKQAGVKKIVVTSSLVAMVGDSKKAHLTQESWTDPERHKVSAYMKSKAHAERAAWDFYEKQSEEGGSMGGSTSGNMDGSMGSSSSRSTGGGKMELTVVNPGPIFGPTLTGHIGASLEIVENLMTGKMPQQPNVVYAMSDVRDIAEIHVQALENERSNGKRFIVTTEESYAFTDVARVLQESGYEKATPKTAPSFLLKVLSLFKPDVKAMMPLVDSHVTVDLSPTLATFDWQPVAFEQTIRDTAKSIASFRS